MALERKWQAVAPRLLTSNGTALGLIQVADTAGFYVKQTVVLEGTSLSALAVQVKSVLSSTELVVGPMDNKIPGSPINITAYTTAAASTVSAPEQDKNNIPEKDHYAAVYESDPVVADRVIGVDPYGRPYGPNNPVPVVVKSLAPAGFGDVKIVYNLDSDPIRYNFFSQSVLSGYITVTYDSNGNPVDYQSFDPSGTPL